MIELSRRPTFAELLSVVQEPQIVLGALARMRWLAVIGQILASAAAVGVLGLRLPLAAIGAVILITALSNAALVIGMKVRRPPGWLVQGVLLLDIVLLTSLLYLTGGPKNPFAALYLVHVTMAVIVLGAGWSWGVVGTVAACYGLLLRWHLPLGGPLPGWAAVGGSWVALALVSVLIAGFIGRVTRALRQREHELAGLREHAAKNEQLAALTTLAAGAAHELNTPLGTIAVVARELELSCNPAGGSDVVIEDAQLIRREVDRCRQILNRMRLDLGEEATQRSSARLDELVTHLRESLSANDQGRLRVNMESDIKSVRAPLTRPRAGAVGVVAKRARCVRAGKTRRVADQPARRAGALWHPRSGLRDVRRFAASRRRAVFHHQGTGKGDGPGTISGTPGGRALRRGLFPGLPPGRRHDMRLRIAGGKLTMTADATNAACKPRVIMIVDDDRIFRERLVKAMTMRGLEAHGAATADEALALAERAAPQAAVVDLRMPGMSGLDLVRELTARHPAMQVVVLTGYGSIGTAVDAVRGGAINYLQKPLDADQILAAFDRDAEAATDASAEGTPSLARVEWEHIQRVLADCEGNISLTARRLGLHRRSLQRKLGKYPPLE